MRMLRYAAKSMRLMLLAAAVAACAPLGVPPAPREFKGAPATPDILGELEGDAAVVTAGDWRARRTPVLREALQKYVYGYFPAQSATELVERRLVDDDAYNGSATIEEWTLSASYNGGHEAHDFKVAVVAPKGDGPHPVIIYQNFCGNRIAAQRADLSSPFATPGSGPCGDVGEDGFMSGVFLFILGEYIGTPPIEKIMSHGFALAFVYPGEVVPDGSESGVAKLNGMMNGDPQAQANGRWGAIGAWAWVYSRIVDTLEADARFDADRIAAWGHSRNGKSALLAAAFDERIDAVISHQSGTGGATLTRSANGESLKKITEDYPHWFNQTYASYAGREDELPVDQHMLIGLIAPRPVFLGNARSDVWSDPQGAFAAAAGADAVYELLGVRGLNQTTLVDVDPTAELAFYMRDGRHGMVAEDWAAFLDFLDAHFK